MSNEPVIWLVGINCPAGEEQKFDTWYADIHVPMLLKGDFVKKVTRFKLAEDAYQIGTTTQQHATWLTIYEFDNQAKFDAWMTSPARIEAGEDKEKTWGETKYDVQWATRYTLTNAWNV